LAGKNGSEEGRSPDYRIALQRSNNKPVPPKGEKKNTLEVTPATYPRIEKERLILNHSNNSGATTRQSDAMGIGGAWFQKTVQNLSSKRRIKPTKRDKGVPLVRPKTNAKAEKHVKPKS